MRARRQRQAGGGDLYRYVCICCMFSGVYGALVLLSVAGCKGRHDDVVQVDVGESSRQARVSAYSYPHAQPVSRTSGRQSGGANSNPASCIHGPCSNCLPDVVSSMREMFSGPAQDAPMPSWFDYILACPMPRGGVELTWSPELVLEELPGDVRRAAILAADLNPQGLSIDYISFGQYFEHEDELYALVERFRQRGGPIVVQPYPSVAPEILWVARPVGVAKIRFKRVNLIFDAARQYFGPLEPASGVGDEYGDAREAIQLGDFGPAYRGVDGHYLAWIKAVLGRMNFEVDERMLSMLSLRYRDTGVWYDGYVLRLHLKNGIFGR